MYIRRTLTRTLASGAQYFSHRLVRSERVDGRVRQVTLLNLGTDFALRSSQWQALCTRIEDLLAGNAVPAAALEAPVVEVEAQRVAALLLARQSRAIPRADGGASATVDLGTLQLTGVRSVGLEQVALWAIRDLRLAEQLQTLGMPQRQIAAALGLIVARMAAASARRAPAWWGEHSALGELLGVDFQAFSPLLLDRAGKSLLKRRKTLEVDLVARVRDLVGPPVGEPIYDLAIRCPGDLRPRPQVSVPAAMAPLILGLVRDQHGFVYRSASFAAAAAEPSIKRMLAGLGAPPGALLAIDRDALGAASVAWLEANGYRFVPGGESGAVRSVFDSLGAWDHSGSAERYGEAGDAADLFLSVLAYQCVHLVRRRLITNGIDADWLTLRQVLAGQCRVTVSVLRSDGRTLHLRQPTCADCDQLAIYQALGIDPAPGGSQQTIV